MRKMRARSMRLTSPMDPSSGNENPHSTRAFGDSHVARPYFQTGLNSSGLAEP